MKVHKPLGHRYGRSGVHEIGVQNAGLLTHRPFAHDTNPYKQDEVGSNKLAGSQHSVVLLPEMYVELQTACATQAPFAQRTGNAGLLH